MNCNLRAWGGEDRSLSAAWNVWGDSKWTIVGSTRLSWAVLWDYSIVLGCFILLGRDCKKEIVVERWTVNDLRWYSSAFCIPFDLQHIRWTSFLLLAGQVIERLIQRIYVYILWSCANGAWRALVIGLLWSLDVDRWDQRDRQTDRRAAVLLYDDANYLSTLVISYRRALNYGQFAVLCSLMMLETGNWNTSFAWPPDLSTVIDWDSLSNGIIPPLPLHSFYVLKS